MNDATDSGPIRVRLDSLKVGDRFITADSKTTLGWHYAVMGPIDEKVVCQQHSIEYIDGSEMVTPLRTGGEAAYIEVIAMAADKMQKAWATVRPLADAAKDAMGDA